MGENEAERLQIKPAEGGGVQEKGECMEVVVPEDDTGEIVNSSKNLLRHYGVYCLETVSDSC